MQKLIFPIITFIISTLLVGCGSIDTDSANTKSIKTDEALKNKSYLKVHIEFSDFSLSHDGTKVYGIRSYDSHDTFYVTDVTRVSPWNIEEDGEEIYQFSYIARLDIELKDTQSFIDIAISPDEKTAYISTRDHGQGALVIVDISNPKNPKVISKNRLNGYISDITIATNGKYLLTPLDETFQVIDIQDLHNPKIVSSIKATDSDNVIRDISISADSKRVYLATDNTREIINLEDPKLPIRINSINIDGLMDESIAVTKNKKIMYSTSFNNKTEIQVYDIEDDKMNLINSYQIHDDGYDNIRNLILSDDDNTLYVQSSDDIEVDSLAIFNISGKGKLDYKKKILAPNNIVFTYDVRDQFLAPDEKKFYSLTGYFYVFNLK